MIEQKTETFKEVQRLKYLKLITPEQANELGVPTESPVFVSPDIVSKNNCSDCGVQFGPLVYQAQYLIKSHHFHEDQGGIYYFGGGGKKAHFIPGSPGWTAVLEPIGKFKDFSPYAHPPSRAEQVQVVEIRAYCVNEFCNKELREGILIFSRISHDLRPLCFDCKFPDHFSSTAYNFKITEDGQVLFSDI